MLQYVGVDNELIQAASDRDPRKVGEEMFLSWMQDSPAAQAAAQRGDVESLAELYNGSQRWGIALRRALDRLPADLSTATGLEVPGWATWAVGGAICVGTAALTWTILRKVR